MCACGFGVLQGALGGCVDDLGGFVWFFVALLLEQFVQLFGFECLVQVVDCGDHFIVWGVVFGLVELVCGFQ